MTKYFSVTGICLNGLIVFFCKTPCMQLEHLGVIKKNSTVSPYCTGSNQLVHSVEVGFE